MRIGINYCFPILIFIEETIEIKAFPSKTQINVQMYTITAYKNGRSAKNIIISESMLTPAQLINKI